MAGEPTFEALQHLDKRIEQTNRRIEDCGREAEQSRADRQKAEEVLAGLQRERALIVAALAGAPTYERPAAEAVPPFAEAYPAPWRFSGCGGEILDAEGCHVQPLATDLFDPDEREFWRGIIEAVNRQALVDDLAAALSALRSAVVAERLAFGRRHDSRELYIAWFDAFDATSQAEGAAASLLLKAARPS